MCLTFICGAMEVCATHLYLWECDKISALKPMTAFIQTGHDSLLILQATEGGKHNFTIHAQYISELWIIVP